MKQVRYLFSGDDQESPNVAGILDSDTDGWWNGVAQTAIRSGIALAFAATSVAAEQSYQQDVLPIAAAPTFSFQEEHPSLVPLLQAKPFVFVAVDEDFAPQAAAPSIAFAEEHWLVPLPVRITQLVPVVAADDDYVVPTCDEDAWLNSPRLPALKAQLFTADDELVQQPAVTFTPLEEGAFVGVQTTQAKFQRVSTTDEEYPQLSAAPVTPAFEEDRWPIVLTQRVAKIILPFAPDDEFVRPPSIAFEDDALPGWIPRAARVQTIPFWGEDQRSLSAISSDQTAFSGIVSIRPRFTGTAAVAPYFSGEMATGVQFNGTPSIADRFSGKLSITPYLEGEQGMEPG